MLRKVQVFKRFWDRHTNTTKKIGDGTALFHKFGVNFEEFESGPAQYSTAIIERQDGTIESIPVDLIQFLTPSVPA